MSQSGSSGSMVIRQLVEADAAAYRELRLRALREDPDAFLEAYNEALARPLASTEERLRIQAASIDSFTLGAFDPDMDRALVGVVTLLRGERAKERHRATIVGMYVAAGARRRGVGRALLEEARARAARVDGLEQLHLAVVTVNAAARQLYRVLGFEPYGVAPRAVKVGDRYLDEEFMVLQLHPS